MHVFRDIVSMRAYLKHQRSTLAAAGLIPTMGALHRGHISLVELSKRENTITVCSIFVNPLQFNNPADLEKDPRPLDDDLQTLRQAGCDAVFCPENSEMYREPSVLKLDFGPLDKILEGEFRPGHFSGVAVVVSKLFNIIQPDRAYFGQKDFQQYRIISRLVEELKFDIRLVCAPIVRDADGLAMSSRNIRLSKEERKRAPVVYQCLKQTQEGLLKGEPFSSLKEKAKYLCDYNNIKLEYLALANSRDLTLLEGTAAPAGEILLMAAYVGEVRLIDNMFLAE